MTVDDPIMVDFPLRGEWVAAATPAERIPSHGTDMLGQRYAYDFLRIDAARSGFKFFRGSMARYLLVGVRLEDCYGWSALFYAPFDATVVAARDGWSERTRLHLLSDFAVAVRNALFFDPARDLRQVAGNHIILKMPGDREVYAFFAHARCGSILVRAGEQIGVGEQLGAVGHSGNSAAPHLHFHLMDRAAIVEAQGIPCCFREYEALRNGTWELVGQGVPAKREFIRYAA